MSFSYSIGEAKELWLPRQQQRDHTCDAVLSEEMWISLPTGEPLAGDSHSPVRHFLGLHSTNKRGSLSSALA